MKRCKTADKTSARGCCHVTGAAVIKAATSADAHPSCDGAAGVRATRPFTNLTLLEDNTSHFKLPSNCLYYVVRKEISAPATA